MARARRTSPIYPPPTSNPTGSRSRTERRPSGALELLREGRGPTGSRSYTPEIVPPGAPLGPRPAPLVTPIDRHAGSWLSYHKQMFVDGGVRPPNAPSLSTTPPPARDRGYPPIPRRLWLCLRRLSGRPPVA